MEVKEVLNERGERYGSFKDHAWLSQSLKRAMQANAGWGSLSCDKKEALEMIQHKIARIINGDAAYKDSWTDIIGYATLVEQSLPEATE